MQTEQLAIHGQELIKSLVNEGYTTLFFRANNHWGMIHVPKRAIVNMVDSDIVKRTFDNETELRDYLQKMLAFFNKDTNAVQHDLPGVIASLN